MNLVENCHIESLGLLKFMLKILQLLFKLSVVVDIFKLRNCVYQRAMPFIKATGITSVRATHLAPLAFIEE